MDLLTLRPETLRPLIESRTPLLIPVGAYEYHGEHLPLGTDTLIAEGLCRRIAERTSAVVAPSFPFTQTMHWAGGAKDGDVDFPPEPFYAYVKAVLASYLDLGFRRIYVMIGHQGREGLPASAFRLAARSLMGERAISFPAGWGRNSELPEPDIFDLIRVCDYDEYIDYEAIDSDERMPIGHAGRGESQLIMALYDDLARMSAIDDMDLPLPEWLSDAGMADPENGALWIGRCVDAWVRQLEGESRVWADDHRLQPG